MVQGAVYDAVNAIAPAYKPYLLDLASAARAAVRLAGCRDRDGGARRARDDRRPGPVDAVDAKYKTTLDPDSDGAPRTKASASEPRRPRRCSRSGRTTGTSRRSRSISGRCRPAGGRVAAPTTADPDAWVGNVKPFLIETPSQFRSKGPNALTSPEYAKDFDEVKSIGPLNSTTRTADQTTAAIFWQFAADRALEPPRPRPLRRPFGLDTRRPGPPLRDREPRGRRRRRSAAGTTSTTGASGGRGPRSRRRRPTATPTPSPTRPGSRCSTRDGDHAAARHAAVPRSSVGPRLPQRRRLRTFRGLLRHGQGRVRHRLGPVARRRPDPSRGTSTASRTRCRRSSKRGSGAASTSGPPTSRARRSGKQIAQWIKTHYFTAALKSRRETCRSSRRRA